MSTEHYMQLAFGYKLTGKAVRQMYSRVLRSGEQVMTWDGEDYDNTWELLEAIAKKIQCYYTEISSIWDVGIVAENNLVFVFGPKLPERCPGYDDGGHIHCSGGCHLQDFLDAMPEVERIGRELTNLGFTLDPPAVQIAVRVL